MKGSLSIEAFEALKAERDDAIARAVEAERLANKAVVDELEAKLAKAQERIAQVEEQREALFEALREVSNWLDAAPVWMDAASEFNSLLKRLFQRHERVTS